MEIVANQEGKFFELIFSYSNPTQDQEAQSVSQINSETKRVSR